MLSWWQVLAGNDKDAGLDDPLTQVEQRGVQFAVSLADLEAEEVEQALADYVAATFEGERQRQALSALRDLADSNGAQTQADAASLEAEQTATSLVEAARRADTLAEAAEADEEVAGAKLEQERGRFEGLALLVRVASRTAWIAAPATAAGLGALVHLALEGVDDQIVKWLLVIAALAGALVAELLLGKLGAEMYDRTRPERRGRLVVGAIVVLVCLLLLSEGLAVSARQEGVDATNAAPKLDRSGQLSSPGSLTPSLWWTGPLSVLLTISGAGAVGMRAVYDGSELNRRRLREHEAHLEDVRLRARDGRQEAARLRSQAEQQLSAAQARGTQAEASVVRSKEMVSVSAAAEPFFVARAERASIKALLAYRAAARHPRPPASPARRPLSAMRLGLATGTASAMTLASAVWLLGGPVALAALSASVVALLSSVALMAAERRQARLQEMA